MLSTRGSSTRCASLLQDHAGSLTPHHHFCRTSRCSHRSAGHHCCLPLVAPSCLAAVESCRGQVLSARCCCACPHCLKISRTWFLKTFQSVSRALFKKQHILFQCTFVERLQNNAHVHVGRHDLAEVFLAFEDITLEECQPWKSPAKLLSSKRFSTSPRARTVSRLASKPPGFPSVSGCPLAASRNVSSLPCTAVHEMSRQRPLTEM